MLSSVLLVLLSLTTLVASTEVDSSNLGCPLINQEYGNGFWDSEKSAYSQLKPLLGKRFSTIDATKVFKYNVGIFRDAVDGFKNVGVLQERLLDKRLHVLGFYNSTRIYSGDDCVVIEYLHGEKYHSHCSEEQRRAIIIIKCDETADDDFPGLKIIRESNGKVHGCYYLFEIRHKAVCRVRSEWYHSYHYQGNSQFSKGAIVGCARFLHVVVVIQILFAVFMN